MKTTIWKTIEIGTKEPKFHKDIRISDWAKDLLKKTTYPKKKEKIDLVIMTLKDLKFTRYTTTTQLLDEANLAKYGVELCPASVAPYLRNEYTDQPMDNWLRIAMTPITDSVGYPSVFNLARGDDGLWLNDRWANPDREWNPGDEFVFQVKNERHQEPILDRIFDKVEKTNYCWNWKGSLRKGYGRIQKGKRSEGLLTVHRVVYEALVKDIPDKMVLDHLCENRACVNPNHMEIVTNQENVKRGIERKNGTYKSEDLDPLTIAPDFVTLEQRIARLEGLFNSNLLK